MGQIEIGVIVGLLWTIREVIALFTKRANKTLNVEMERDQLKNDKMLNMQQTLETQAVQLKTLTEQVQTLTEQVAKLTNEKDNDQKLIKVQNESINKLNMQVATIQHELEDTKKERDLLSAQLKEMMRELEETRKELIISNATMQGMKDVLGVMNLLIEKPAQLKEVGANG